MGFQRIWAWLWVLISVISEVSMTVPLKLASGKSEEPVLCRDRAAVSVSPTAQGVAAITEIRRTICLVNCSHHPKVTNGFAF